jgi:hypothetical protein
MEKESSRDSVCPQSAATLPSRFSRSPPSQTYCPCTSAPLRSAIYKTNQSSDARRYSTAYVIFYYARFLTCWLPFLEAVYPTPEAAPPPPTFLPTRVSTQFAQHQVPNLLSTKNVKRSISIYFFNILQSHSWPSHLIICHGLQQPLPHTPGREPFPPLQHTVRSFQLVRRSPPHMGHRFYPPAAPSRGPELHFPLLDAHASG